MKRRGSTGPARFSRQALRDFEDAVDWLAENRNANVARRMAGAIQKGVRRIGDHAAIGWVRPEYLPPRYRFWPVPGFPYLLVYDSESSPPRIVRLLHAARDLRPLLKDLAEP